MLTEAQEFQIDFNQCMVPAPAGLPVPTAAVAAMLGADVDDVETYMEEAETRTTRAALRLLSRPELRRTLDRWPGAGANVLFVGDSITTYRYSYARLIEAMVDIRCPGHGATFLNVAQSGYTTTHMLEQTYTQFVAQQPDWVFIKLGVNDSKQFGGAMGCLLVPPDVYAANLNGIVSAFQAYTSARIILLAPTPVVEPVTNALPDFMAMRMTWDNRVIRGYGDRMRAIAEQRNLRFIDLFELFGPTPDPAQYVAGGLHPNLQGHERIAAQILLALGDA